jgi:DNA-binding transcriptional ArsR family regulator
VDLIEDITDPRLAKALAHPLRLEILRRLGDRTASPSEIAEEIGAPLTNVSYHVRKLRALGLIKLVRKTPKRGVVEHYYSANPRRNVTDEAWAETPSIVKEALVGPTAEMGLDQIVKAAHAGGFDRTDAHLSQSYMELDEQGWKALAAVLIDMIRSIATIEDEAGERLRADGAAAPIHVGNVLALFEMTASINDQTRKEPAPKRRSAKRRGSAARV